MASWSCFCSASMSCSMAARRSADNFSKASGRITSPSLVGARARPVGVRMSVTFFSAACFCSSSKALSWRSLNSSSTTWRRARYSSLSKIAGTVLLRSSTRRSIWCLSLTPVPGGRRSVRGRCDSSKLLT